MLLAVLSPVIVGNQAAAVQAVISMDRETAMAALLAKWL